MRFTTVIIAVALVSTYGFCQSIVDLFEMVPDSSVLGLTKAQRIEIVKFSRASIVESRRGKTGSSSVYYEIDTTQISNNYIRLTGGFEGHIQMRFWRMKNSKKLLAVYREGCGPVCYMEQFDLYAYDGKSLKSIGRDSIIPDVYADFFLGNYMDQLEKIRENDVSVTLLFDLLSKGDDILAKWGNEGSKDVYKTYGKGDRMNLIWTGEKFRKGDIYWKIGDQ